jgi:hypothetical protein
MAKEIYKDIKENFLEEFEFFEKSIIDYIEKELSR